MKLEHTESLDLNLLMLFHQVWTQRSVSRAAERLGLTQSAVSHGLARLRLLFDDQLFVRAGGAMVPTPRAAALAIPIHEVIERLERDIMPRARFDAGTAKRSFSIAMSDLGEIVVLPPLLQQLALQAPGCRIASVRVPNGQIEDALEDGSVDLALGNVFEPRRNCFQQTLYTHDFRVIAWDAHPRLGKRLSLAQYQAEKHLVAQNGSEEHLRLQVLAPAGVQARGGGHRGRPAVTALAAARDRVAGHRAQPPGQGGLREIPIAAVCAAAGGHALCHQVQLACPHAQRPRPPLAARDRL